MKATDGFHPEGIGAPWSNSNGLTAVSASDVAVLRDLDANKGEVAIGAREGWN
jgi:hypothetical protein